jgi:hypothetical protein
MILLQMLVPFFFIEINSFSLDLPPRWRSKSLLLMLPQLSIPKLHNQLWDRADQMNFWIIYFKLFVIDNLLFELVLPMRCPNVSRF